MKECNYPVKYAVLPLYDVVGRDGFGQRNYDIVAYIVTKAYLLGETKIYRENGDVEYDYKVFFPYMSYLEIIKDKRHDIDYNDIRKWNNNQYINSVSNVYETYEEAKQEAEYLNEKGWVYCYTDIEEYLNVESILLEHTENMKITKENTKKKIKIKNKFNEKRKD